MGQGKWEPWQWIYSIRILFSVCLTGYEWNDDKSACNPCPIGTYITDRVPYPRLITYNQCTSCPDGTTTGSEGQSSIDACNSKCRKLLLKRCNILKQVLLSTSCPQANAIVRRLVALLANKQTRLKINQLRGK